MVEVKKAQVEGYAINDQEVEIGLRTIAVPVLDQSGKVRAVMSISTSKNRADARALVHNLLPELDSARSKLASMLHV